MFLLIPAAHSWLWCLEFGLPCMPCRWSENTSCSDTGVLCELSKCPEVKGKEGHVSCAVSHQLSHHSARVGSPIGLDCTFRKVFR